MVVALGLVERIDDSVGKVSPAVVLADVRKVDEVVDSHRHSQTAGLERDAAQLLAGNLPRTRAKIPFQKSR